MDYQKFIESFFTMLGRFDFDRAKIYIDQKKDVLQRLAPTFPNQSQLMTMLTTFGHLAEAEKNYHNQPYNNQPQHHSFLSTTNFLRRAKTLKDMYNDILIELQQLEQMETTSDLNSSNNESSDSNTSSPINIQSPTPKSGYEAPPNSTTTTPVAPTISMRGFSEKLISHFCKQLQNFIQARLDMIDVYEKLTESSSRKYTTVDGIAFRLSMLCRQYHKYFHHPLLAPIKEGMTIECDTLMTLIKATIDLQHWRFLHSLNNLQDAQSKLNYWAASTFNKDASKRRFKISKTQSAPRLYEWLCKFKDFLIAKFTLYFHDTLSKSFPPSNFRSMCSKLSIDYYAKLSSFQRKVDALFVALMYDVSNEKDFRGPGYYFPSKDYCQPQGKNTLQPMVIIPPESQPKLSNLQAEIYMIVVTNQQAMIEDGNYQFHDSKKKLTYSISKPESSVALVIVCEGQKTDREATIRMFSQEITNHFAFLNVFSNQ